LGGEGGWSGGAGTRVGARLGKKIEEGSSNPRSSREKVKPRHKGRMHLDNN